MGPKIICVTFTLCHRSPNSVSSRIFMRGIRNEEDEVAARNLLDFIIISGSCLQRRNVRHFCGEIPLKLDSYCSVESSNQSEFYFLPMHNPAASLSRSLFQPRIPFFLLLSFFITSLAMIVGWSVGGEIRSIISGPRSLLCLLPSSSGSG